MSSDDPMITESTVNSQNLPFTVSSDVLKAQEQAEKELENYSNDDLSDDKNGNLLEHSAPTMPKLLQLPQNDLKQKTHELKAKGQQLDLLLLKAESYSQFIVSNLQSSSHQAGNKQQSSSSSSDMVGDADTPKISSKKGSKRLSTPSSTTSSVSSKKKSKMDDQQSPSPAVTTSTHTTAVTATPDTKKEGMDSNVFTQPPNLVGGRLLSYQLEGLRWLLSLWENGLSGILADEMVRTYYTILFCTILYYNELYCTVLYLRLHFLYTYVVLAYVFKYCMCTFASFLPSFPHLFPLSD